MKAILTMMMIFGLSSVAPAKTFSEKRHDVRQDYQKKRIKRGVKNGSLTKWEIKRLKKQQKRIARLERRMEADGKLTRGEKRRLERRQNRASRRIYRLKHNRRGK